MNDSYHIQKKGGNGKNKVSFTLVQGQHNRQGTLAMEKDSIQRRSAMPEMQLVIVANTVPSGVRSQQEQSPA